MSDQDLFNSPNDEVKRLVDELRETKEALRDVSRMLANIESRIRRSFPSLFPRPLAKKRVRMEYASDQPTMTPEQATKLYEELVGQAKKDEYQTLHERLVALTLPDLNLLRRELGASIGTKKPSRRVLEEAILGRIRQSVLLTKHADRDRIIEKAENSSVLPKKIDETG